MANFTRHSADVDTAAASVTRTFVVAEAPTAGEWYIVRFIARGGDASTSLTVTSSTGGWSPGNGATWGTPVVEFLSGGGNRFIMSVPVQAGTSDAGSIVATFNAAQGDSICLIATAPDLTGTRVQWDPDQGIVTSLTPTLGVDITAGNDALAAVCNAIDQDYTWASGYTSLGARVYSAVGSAINGEDADVDSTDTSAAVSWVDTNTRAAAILEEWERDAGGGGGQPSGRRHALHGIGQGANTLRPVEIGRSGTSIAEKKVA